MKSHCSITIGTESTTHSYPIVSRPFPQLFDDLEGPFSTPPSVNDCIHTDMITSTLHSDDGHPTTNCVCKITEIEGTHCKTCKLEHHISVVLDMTLMTTVLVPVRTPISTLYPRITAGSHLPTLVSAPKLSPGGFESSLSSSKVCSAFNECILLNKLVHCDIVLMTNFIMY